MPAKILWHASGRKQKSTLNILNSIENKRSSFGAAELGVPRADYEDHRQFP